MVWAGLYIICTHIMLDFKLGGSRECFVSFLYIEDDFAVGERSRSGCRGCLLGFKLASEME